MNKRKITSYVSFVLAIGFFVVNNFIKSTSVGVFCQIFFAFIFIFTHDYVYNYIKKILKQNKELDKLDLELK